jgi:hypothetical protein
MWTVDERIDDPSAPIAMVPVLRMAVKKNGQQRY